MNFTAQDLTAEKIADYEQFWPSLDEALDILIKARRDAKVDPPKGRPMGYKAFLDEKRPRLGSRFMAARSGLHVLDAADLQFMRNIVLKPEKGRAIGEQLYDRINRGWKVHDEAHIHLSAKNNGFRAPGFIRATALDTVYRSLCGDKLKFEWLLEEPRFFWSFLGEHVNGPASGSEHGVAMVNALAICRHLLANRKSYPQLSDDTLFVAYTSMCARIGGWAAQQVGQWSKFDEFFGIIKNLKKSTEERTTLIAYNQMLVHRYNGRNAIFGGDYTSGFARAAYTAQHDLKPGPFAFVDASDIVSSVNAAHELYMLGRSVKDKDESVGGQSIQSLLEYNPKVDDAIMGARTVNKVGAYALLGTTYINTGHVEHAEAELEKGWAVLDTLDFKSPHGERHLLTLKGRIEHKKRGVAVNRYMRKARQIAFEMGAFHKVAEIDQATAAMAKAAAR